MSKIKDAINEKREARREEKAKKQNITQQNIEESREEILAKGKKFKYPFQYAKHRLIINAIATTPAVKVVDSVCSPKDAPTVLELTSDNFAGSEPLLIKSTKFCTSSSVKLP